jgi:hypothetical protein
MQHWSEAMTERDGIDIEDMRNALETSAAIGVGWSCNTKCAKVLADLLTESLSPEPSAQHSDYAALEAKQRVTQLALDGAVIERERAHRDILRAKYAALELRAKELEAYKRGIEHWAETGK